LKKKAEHFVSIASKRISRKKITFEAKNYDFLEGFQPSFSSWKPSLLIGSFGRLKEG